nr:hypothetical protein [uncultured Desulfobacter sp.]
MNRSDESKLAVPVKGILMIDDDRRLGLETSSWMHLNGYMTEIEQIPEVDEGRSDAMNQALDNLRSVIRDFGPPKQFRQWVKENPNALDSQDAPELIYAGIVWVVKGLHEFSVSVVSTLKGMQPPKTPDKDVRSILLLLGKTAQEARNKASVLTGPLEKFRKTVTEANGVLSDTCKENLKLLQQAQEDIGALKFKITSQEEQISRLGFFSSVRKKKDLQAEVDFLKQTLEEKSTQTENQRKAYGRIESLLEKGVWLDPGLNDILTYLKTLKTVWTMFGSGVTQLAADALDTQITDPAWMEKKLGFQSAIRQWEAVERAAKKFVARALVDFPAE